MAFVVVPKGDGRKGVSTGSLPPPVKTALAHHGNSVDFKDGISIFGEANVQSAGAIRTLLNSVGHSQMTLPLSAALPTGLFGVDMKKTTRLIKDTILEHLNLQMALPRLTIPGMPSMVSVKEARLVIVGEKKGTDINIVAGVTGNLDVDLHGTKHDFGFNILAVRGGQADQLQLNASTKNKISLPLIHPLDVLG